MLRLTTIVLLALAATVLAPQGVSAQTDCICGVGDAAAELASEDPNISFVDAMSVMSAMRAQAVEEALETPDRHTVRGIVRPTPRPRRGESILWCFHSDDPRCAPAAPADPTPSVALRTPFTFPTLTFAVQPPSWTWPAPLEERSMQEADASSGLELARLLERPPRS